MQTFNIPVGISDFSEIRQNGYYYVDKTGLIAELLNNSTAKVTLITRPRRFGKTLGMSMLAAFFDIHKNSDTLFEGLEISKDTASCQKWMNQYPTLFLTFKDVDGLNFDDAYGQLAAQIADLYKEHAYLLDCPIIDSDDKQIFLELKAGTAGKIHLSRSLVLLMRMMKTYYHKPVILLLDEYDVPLAKASSHGYYTEMLSLIKTLLSTALKDNPNLCFSVITGCLKIAKESIFTGTNNFVSDTISHSRLNEYFGFTENDVNTLLKEAHAELHASQVKYWYDGYHFGDFDVYCPWDVMNYLRDLQINPQAQPSSYWKNTSDNAIIRSFIDYAGNTITKKLEKLLSGEYILQRIDENLTCDYLHASEDNLWSILYLTGYLTRADTSQLSAPETDGVYALKIPNAEIREIFETTVIKWFDDSARTWNRQVLFQAVWNTDCSRITDEMTKLLRKTISYHDYREDYPTGKATTKSCVTRNSSVCFYHAFLTGIFAGAGYIVESNKEHGEGRSDVVVYDTENNRVAIFEAKYAKSLEQMEQDSDSALQQIDEKMYAKEYEDEYDQILCYGIAFFKKRCLVKAVKKD